MNFKEIKILDQHNLHLALIVPNYFTLSDIIKYLEFNRVRMIGNVTELFLRDMRILLTSFYITHYKDYESAVFKYQGSEWFLHKEFAQ